MKLQYGTFRLDVRKMFFIERVLEKAPLGYGTKTAVVQEAFGQCFWTMLSNFGVVLCGARRLQDLMILVGPF